MIYMLQVEKRDRGPDNGAYLQIKTFQNVNVIFIALSLQMIPIQNTDGKHLIFNGKSVINININLVKMETCVRKTYLTAIRDLIRQPLTEENVRRSFLHSQALMPFY